MKKNCTITCKGRVTIQRQASWINKVAGNINRLYYISSGKGSYLEGGVMYPFEVGKFYFIPSYAGISTFTDESNPLNHVFVNYKLTPPIVSNKVFALDASKTPTLRAITDAFCDLCRENVNFRLHTEEELQNWEKEINLLSAITVYLTECAIEAHPDYVLSNPDIISALNIIHSSLKEKLTVADIAKRLNISTDGFIRKFTRYVGETPYSYIKKLKARTALTMKAEGMKLDEIADACGYSDASALLHAIASVEGKVI